MLYIPLFFGLNGPLELEGSRDGWWGLFTVLSQAGLRGGKQRLGLQESVDPLELGLGQNEAVDLLLAPRTRHHDSTHQHCVRMFFLGRLKTKKKWDLRVHLCFSQSVRQSSYLNEGGWWERCKVRWDSSSRLQVDDMLCYLTLSRNKDILIETNDSMEVRTFATLIIDIFCLFLWGFFGWFLLCHCLHGFECFYLQFFQSLSQGLKTCRLFH